MAHKAPGKASRTGITLMELFRMFPDDATAEAWFEARRWSKGVRCPRCQSDNIQADAKHKDHALPLPRLPFREGFRRGQVQHQDWHRHASLQHRLSEVGDCHLSVQHQPQGRIVHEVAPGPGNLTEGRLAHGPPPT